MFEQFAKEFSELLGNGLSSQQLSIVEKELLPFLISDELTILYQQFNGMDYESNFGLKILSFNEALSERSSYAEMFQSENMKFPRAMFPIARFNYGNYWIPLSQFPTKNTPVFEYAVSEGENEIYLIYDSVTSFLHTLLEEKNELRKNKYPGSSEHYVDYDAVRAVQPRINKDMYKEGQKSRKSPNGVFNVYDMDNLPAEWM